jgi:hypothetical protein
MISLAATGYAKPPDQIVRNFASRFSTFGPLVSSPLRVGSHNDQINNINSSAWRVTESHLMLV